jgi:hypothetical protein
MLIVVLVGANKPLHGAARRPGGRWAGIARWRRVKIVNPRKMFNNLIVKGIIYS